MRTKGLLAEILMVVGAVLVWLPLLAPVFFLIVALLSGRGFLFDYLMPAELFPLAIVGGVLLLAAGIWTRLPVKLIAVSLTAAAGLLIGSQAIAEASGLASGTAEPGGVWWSVIVTLLGLFIAAMIGMGVGGLLLLRGLIKSRAITKGGPTLS